MQYPQKNQKSWFSELILNNKVIVTLINTLLIILIIFMFTKISYLFEPIRMFVDLIAFPVIFAGVLYYLFSPLVEYFERRNIKRTYTIWAIFLILLLLIIWGLSTLVPLLRQQSQSFINNLPGYRRQFESLFRQLPSEIREGTFAQTVFNYFDSFDLTSLATRFENILSSTFGGLGSVIGSITQFIAGLLTMPLILYYLLLEGDKVTDHILYFIPTKYRSTASRMMYRSNYQVSQYIRGQIIVAIIVALMFLVGYSIIGIDYAVSLSLIAGFLNVIPYLGSIIAVIPALLIGLLTSPAMFIKVVIVMSLEQFIEGRFVSPQVLGTNLEVHPVTILFILLGAGKVFGIAGVVLGVPGYAVIKVVATEIYQLHRERSQAYGEPETPFPFDAPMINNEGEFDE